MHFTSVINPSQMFLSKLLSLLIESSKKKYVLNVPLPVYCRDSYRNVQFLKAFPSDLY